MRLSEFKDNLKVKYHRNTTSIEGMLHEGDDGLWYILHNDVEYMGAEPPNNWRHKGYSYGWSLAYRGGNQDADVYDLQPVHCDRWADSKLTFKFVV